MRGFPLLHALFGFNVWLIADDGTLEPPKPSIQTSSVPSASRRARVSGGAWRLPHLLRRAGPRGGGDAVLRRRRAAPLLPRKAPLPSIDPPLQSSPCPWVILGVTPSAKVFPKRAKLRSCGCTWLWVCCMCLFLVIAHRPFDPSLGPVFVFLFGGGQCPTKGYKLRMPLSILTEITVQGRPILCFGPDENHWPTSRNPVPCQVPAELGALLPQRA